MLQPEPSYAPLFRAIQNKFYVCTTVIKKLRKTSSILYEDVVTYVCALA